MSFRPTILALLATCTMLQTACGTKGPLTLPGAAPEQTRAKPAEKSVGDNNSKQPAPSSPASQ